MAPPPAEDLILKLCRASACAEASSKTVQEKVNEAALRDVLGSDLSQVAHALGRKVAQPLQLANLLLLV